MFKKVITGGHNCQAVWAAGLAVFLSGITFNCGRAWQHSLYITQHEQATRAALLPGEHSMPNEVLHYAAENISKLPIDGFVMARMPLHMRIYTLYIYGSSQTQCQHKEQLPACYRNACASMMAISELLKSSKLNHDDKRWLVQHKFYPGFKAFKKRTANMAHKLRYIHIPKN